MLAGYKFSEIFMVILSIPINEVNGGEKLLAIGTLICNSTVLVSMKHPGQLLTTTTYQHLSFNSAAFPLKTLIKFSRPTGIKSYYISCYCQYTMFVKWVIASTVPHNGMKTSMAQLLQSFPIGRITPSPTS